MTELSIDVREAQPKDLTELLELMIRLADFESYRDKFSVTQEDLEQRLFMQKDFHVLVAESENQLVGMLVYYYLPFTYDLKPWIYIKELFVNAEFRAMKTGQKLMQALAIEAKRVDATKIRWDVLNTNEPAQKFYSSLGAQADKEWALYGLSKPAITKLAESGES